MQSPRSGSRVLTQGEHVWPRVGEWAGEAAHGTRGETLYSQPFGVSAPYTPWDDKLVGLAFHFAEMWAGGHQRCFCAWSPPSPSLSGGPAWQEEGRWVRQGSANLARTELACPHRARSPGALPGPGTGLRPRGALAAGCRQEARPPPPVSWGDGQSWGACRPCLFARLLHLGRVGLRPLPRGSWPSQLRRWLSVSPPST